KRVSGFLRTLRAVLGARLLAVLDTLEVKRTANDVVTNTRQILDTTAADQHNRVLLQVVAFTTDVGDDLETVGQTNFRNLTQRGVRLLRRRRVDTGAYTALLRAGLKRRHLALDDDFFPRLADELIDSRHISESSNGPRR